MRQLLFLSVSILFYSAVTAQTEGRIVYERKINMHRRIPKEDESMKQMMPEFNVSKAQLLFTGEESIFSNLEPEENLLETAGEDGRNKLVIRMAGQENEVYKNYRQFKITELRQLGPRKYLIEDSLPRYKWQLKDETKIIKGYTCKKAVTVNREQMPVVAWYTEQILSASGPESWGGLPGLILELDIDNGGIVYTAFAIENTLNKQTVKAPTGGKKITNEEFAKMMKESMGPEGGPRRVIIREVD